MNAKTQSNRIAYWDNLKAILIFLVVLGHIVPECGAITYWLRFAIYTFHMPAFVFVSGFFSKKAY